MAFIDQDIMNKLSLIGLEGTSDRINSFSDQQRKDFFCWVRDVDVDFIKRLKETWLHRGNDKTLCYKPLLHYDYYGLEDHLEKGFEVVGDGKVGCLIVAGGQASRLHCDGPKGAFPTSVIKNKSLFQILSEKALAAGRQHNVVLPVAIMTSPLNHSQTVQFFDENAYFGLQRDQISFFSQGTLPLLNEKGDLFFDAPGHIAEAPDGNGYALHAFYRSDIWHQWYESGIRYLNFIIVDNSLGDPFDINLVGCHVINGNDVTVKCVLRESPQESVGIMAMDGNRLTVVEYSEIEENERSYIMPDGSLKYPCANISNFCFGMDFIRRLVEERQNMPLHLAYKAVKFLDDDNQVVVAQKPNSWKFESFIFDVWTEQDNVGILVCPRDRCFAPLKNAQGADSISTVHQALLKNERRLWEELTGTKVPQNLLFELDQQFYYPNVDKSKFLGKTLSQGYVKYISA